MVVMLVLVVVPAHEVGGQVGDGVEHRPTREEVLDGRLAELHRGIRRHGVHRGERAPAELLHEVQHAVLVLSLIHI